MRLATEAIMLLSISPVIIFHVSSRELHEAFFLSVQDNGKQFYTQGLLKKCSITLGSFDFCLAIFITHIKIQFLLFLMKSVSVLLCRKDRKQWSATIQLFLSFLCLFILFSFLWHWEGRSKQHSSHMLQLSRLFRRYPSC